MTSTKSVFEVKTFIKIDDTIINTARVNYVEQRGLAVYVHFAAEDFLTFTRDSGQAVWDYFSQGAIDLNEMSKRYKCQLCGKPSDTGSEHNDCMIEANARADWELSIEQLGVNK